MYVSCEGCATEYEFDDALVSSRGTSVKCTQCGHEFRVFRGQQNEAAERWRVRVQDGTVYEYRELRELQRAIAAGRITPDDVLVRDGSFPRALGAIPELESFFVQAGVAPRSLPPVAPIVPRATVPTPLPPPAMPTPLGLDLKAPVVPPGRAAGTIPYGVAVPTGFALQSRPPVRSEGSRPPPAVAHPAPRSSPPQGALASSASPSSPAALRSSPSSPSSPSSSPPAAQISTSLDELAQAEEPTRKRPVSIPPEVGAGVGAGVGANANPSAATSARSVVAQAAATSEPSLSLTPSLAVYGAARGDASGDRASEFPHMSRESVAPEPYSVASYRGSRGGLRWVVAIVGIGAMAVAGTALWKGVASSAKSAATEGQDARVYDLVVAGDKALAEGDIDEASDRYSKASAMAESDVRVQVGLSRLSAIRADVAWLKLRLLPADAMDARNVAASELAETSARARRAAEKANERAPDDTSVLRVRVDALRLMGERAGARALAPKLASQGSTPEASYVLAALELGEEHPAYSTAIERLRIAAAAEKLPGRAHAALVYALSRSGDAAGAKVELDRMATASRPHPLLADLRAFVQADPSRTTATSAASASASAMTTTIATLPASALPSVPSVANTPVVTAERGDRGDRGEREAPSKPGEFSEEELHRALQQPGVAPTGTSTGGGKSDLPAPPTAKPAPSPTIDTSDLPGVMPK